MQQPQQYYLNENESSDVENLNETNRIENSFINENRQLLETIKSSKKNYDVDMFINEIREYPCMWNTSLNYSKKMHGMSWARNLDVQVRNY